MRLLPEQIQSIIDTIHELTNPHTRIFLYGSRLNDQALGGDIDLLIETDTALSLLQRAKIKMTLESQLNLPVDIIAKVQNQPANTFQSIALTKAVQLGKPRWNPPA